MYSSSKNVLTGVIESSETLIVIANIYSKTLVWHCIKTLFAQLDDTETKQETMQIIPHSSSIEAMNLESWPTSESSTELPRVTPSKSAAYVSTSSSESIPSFFEENEILPNKRKGLLPPIKLEPNLPGGIFMTPQVARKKSVTSTVISPSQSPRHGKNEPSLFDHLSPPKEWLEAVKTVKGFLEDEQSLDMTWFKICLNHHSNNYLQSKSYSKDQYMAISRDVLYLQKINKLIQGCFRLVYGSSSAPEDVAPTLGPSLVIRAFTGKTQQSTLTKVPKLLENVVLPAYRSAVKAGLDQIIINGDSIINYSDLEDTLHDIDTNWHLGLEDSKSWACAIHNQVPNLFTVISADQSGQPSQMNSSRRQVYRSHMLKLQECSVKIGRLNSEVVRSLWASLSWELLYLTNDDDERYSIQAEERLLKNLTVEVADPPLGYPAFTSKAIRHGLEYF